MDDRTRLKALLRELREQGVRELYLDGLTAAEARALVKGGDPHPVTAGVAAPERRGVARRGVPEGLKPPAAPVAGEPGTNGALKALEQEISRCTDCGLCDGRTRVVFGRGNGTADLVVVGEAPGMQEDRTGLPFVGPAGQLLDLLLLSVGFDRESVYICNVLKCRPPNNRDPLPEEVAACSKHLHEQLDAVAPKVLLAVGKFSAQWLTGSEESIGRLRGRIHEYRGVPVIATYHPAYLLRSPQATRKTWNDLQLMRQVLDEHA